MRIEHPTTQAGPAEWFTGKVWLDQIANLARCTGTARRRTPS
jgi:hypothetical protein